MFKNMKIGAKLASGFRAITILAIIVGIAGYAIINNINHQVEVAETACIIKENCLETRRQEKNYIIRKQEKDFKRWEESVEEIKTSAAKGQKLTDDGDVQGWLRDGLKELERYEGLGHEFHKLILKGMNLDDQMRYAGRVIGAYLKKLEGSDVAMVALLNARRQEKNILIYGDKVLRQGEKTYLQKWTSEMANINNWSGADNDLKNLTAKYENLVSQRANGLKRLVALTPNLETAARTVIKNANQILDKAQKAMHKAENIGKTLIDGYPGDRYFDSYSIGLFHHPWHY